MIQQFHFWDLPEGNRNTSLKRLYTPMFTVAFFTIVKTWQPVRCPSTDERIKTKNFMFIYIHMHTYITHIYFIYLGASLVAQMVKNLPAMQETQVWSLGWEDPLEKRMATHSGILAWRIPWVEEPGGLQSMGLQKSQAKFCFYMCPTNFKSLITLK